MALVPPSFEDFLAQGRAIAQDRRPDLAFLDGDMTEADAHSAGLMADNVTRFTAQALKRTFIDSCEGDDLDALINDHLNLQRQGATAAQVQLSFSRTSAGASGTIDAGFVVTSDPDASGVTVSFQTLASIIVPPGSNGPFLVQAQCLETGPDGNVAAGTLESLGAVFDPTFAVTNPSGAGGGNNRQSDTEYREAARSFWQSLRRGTLGALEVGAKTVPTVRIATAIEDPDSGLVTLLVTDSDGNSTLQMVNDVIVAIEDWRVAGPSLTVTGGSRLIVDMTLALVVRTGFDVSAVSSTLIASAVNRVARLAGRASMYLDMIRASVINLFPDDILQVQVLSILVAGSPVPVTTDPIVPGVAQVVRAGSFTVQPA